MKNFSNRILFACLSFSVLILMAGCNEHVINNNERDGSSEEFLKTDVEKEGEESTPLSFSVSKISLISQNGMEVAIEPQIFEQTLEKYVPDLGLVENTEATGSPVYTVIGWDKQSQPMVIQVYPTEMKIGQKYYSGSRYQLFTQWLKEYLGQHYFESLVMDRITLKANDLGMIAQIPDPKAQEIYSIIKDSTVQKGDIRIVSPLYPYYQLDIEYSGKDYLSIEVISPTLIALQDGQDRWYYQLSQSLFSYVTEVIPIQDYSLHHIKHLYQAVGLRIQQKDQVVHVEESMTDELKMKAFIQQIARILSNTQQLQSTEHLEEQEQTMEFVFSFMNNERKKVQVFENYFIYDGQFFSNPNIQDQLMDTIKLFEGK